MLAEKAKSQDTLIAEYEAREQAFEEQGKRINDLRKGLQEYQAKLDVRAMIVSIIHINFCSITSCVLNK